MKFFALGAQAVGDFGRNTVMGSYQDRPPKVSKFHLELDRWPKDDIVETLATYAVTKRLVQKLSQAKLSGFIIEAIEVSTSPVFEEWMSLHQGEMLPEFFWLKVQGKPGIDDFGLIQGECELPLIVSERALKVLRQCNLSVCDIEDYHEHKLSAAG